MEALVEKSKDRIHPTQRLQKALASSKSNKKSKSTKLKALEKSTLRIWLGNLRLCMLKINFSAVAILSIMHLPLINADCQLSARDHMTLLNLVAKILEMVFKFELIKLKGLQSEGDFEVSTLGMRVMQAQLIHSRLALPKQKSSQRITNSVWTAP